MNARRETSKCASDRAERRDEREGVLEQYDDERGASTARDEAQFAVVAECVVEGRHTIEV